MELIIKDNKEKHRFKDAQTICAVYEGEGSSFSHIDADADMAAALICCLVEHYCEEVDEIRRAAFIETLVKALGGKAIRVEEVE